MAGRKPKPTVLKKLEGNPCKRKLNTKGTAVIPDTDLSCFSVEWLTVFLVTMTDVRSIRRHDK